MEPGDNKDEVSRVGKIRRVSTNRRVFAAALITTTVREQHPRSHLKDAASMQTHPAVRVGFELVTDASISMSLPLG